MSCYGIEDTIEVLKTKNIFKVTLQEQQLTFECDDGSVIKLGVEGDCCSHSWFETMSLDGMLDLEKNYVFLDKAKLLSVDEIDGSTQDDGDRIITTVTRFKTTKGNIDITWKNSSNGYYSGFMVSLP